MNDKEKRAISDRCEFLVKNLLAGRLCPHLVENHVITIDEMAKVCAQQTRLEEARILLEYIIHSPNPGTFDFFCDALSKEDGEYLEAELRSTLSHLQDEDETDHEAMCNLCTENGIGNFAIILISSFFFLHWTANH